MISALVRRPIYSGFLILRTEPLTEAASKINRGRASDGNQSRQDGSEWGGKASDGVPGDPDERLMMLCRAGRLINSFGQ